MREEPKLGGGVGQIAAHTPHRAMNESAGTYVGDQGHHKRDRANEDGDDCHQPQDGSDSCFTHAESPTW
jgi:hypothetical protein